MQTVLNFSAEEKKEIISFLKKFKKAELKTGHEEAKAVIEGCAVTLYKSGKLLIQGKSHEKAKEIILAKVAGKNELILGIDETGRGENYGPLVVAGVLGETHKLRELRDSKKTRDIAGKAKIVEKNSLGTKFIEIPAAKIDSMREDGKNLNQIEADAINEIISFFEKEFPKKKFGTIIDGSKINGISKAVFLPKADDKIVQVAAASIIAKDARNKSKDKDKRETWANS
jgi:ribonuclease HIII